MLDHLVDDEAPWTPTVEADPSAGFVPTDKVPPRDLLQAAHATSTFVDEMGIADEVIVSEAQRQQSVEAARKTFGLMASGKDADAQRAAIVSIQTPPGVAHVVGMLTAYDWEFIEQAKQLRGYVVTKLVEESQGDKPRDRLKALELLGKVTEVGLFTEKLAVTNERVDDADLDRIIKEKMLKLGLVQDAKIVSEGSNG